MLNRIVHNEYMQQIYYSSACLTHVEVTLGDMNEESGAPSSPFLMSWSSNICPVLVVGDIRAAEITA